MPAVVRLSGRVGHLSIVKGSDESGLMMVGRIGARDDGSSEQRCVAVALTAGTLAVCSDAGAVYALHPGKRRFVCLDAGDGTAAVAAVFVGGGRRRLAVGSKRGDIHVFDAAAPSAARVARLPGHRGGVASLSASGSGGRGAPLLVSTGTGRPLLWDCSALRQVAPLHGDVSPGSVTCAALCPGGDLIAMATLRHVSLWGVPSLPEPLACALIPACRGGHHLCAPSCLCFAHDAHWLAVGMGSLPILLLYETAPLKLQHAVCLPKERSAVVQVDAFPDGRHMADGSVSFLDVVHGHALGELAMDGARWRAASLALEAGARHIALTCSDGAVRLYDMATVLRSFGTQQASSRLTLLDSGQLADHLDRCAHLVAAPAPRTGYTAGDFPGGVLVEGDGPSTSGADIAARGSTASAPRVRGAHHTAGSRLDNHHPPTAAVLIPRPLCAAAAALNTRKLRQLLRSCGHFPERYRLLAWQHLLQLPLNGAAFALLQDQGPHAAYCDVATTLPGSLGQRLQACLSQLAHWCPLAAETSFLPRLAFPFVKLCSSLTAGSRARTAFELLATLLTNHCAGWFEAFPNPPVQLLHRFLLLLTLHDAELGGHLRHLGTAALVLLWEQLACGLSELLPHSNDWAVLWDHVVAAEDGPCFLYASLAAALLCHRRLLLDAQDAQQLARVLAARPPLDVSRLVARAHTLHSRTPLYARVGPSSLMPLAACPQSTPTEAVDVGGATRTALLSSAANSGSYRCIIPHPVGSVEVAAAARQRIQEAEDALLRRRELVAELEQRSRQVAHSAAALSAQRAQLAALDGQRRAKERSLEDALAAANARLDDRAKEQKLRNARLVEHAFTTTLGAMRSEWAAELAELKADVEHKRRHAAAAIKARQEDQDVQALEFSAQQRLWALQQHELSAIGSSALQDAAAAQAALISAERQRKEQEWRAQDELRTLRRQQETLRRTSLVAAAEQEAARQQAAGLLLTRELQARQELEQLEHRRQLQQVMEAESELTMQALQAQTQHCTALGAEQHQAAQAQAAMHHCALNSRLAEQSDGIRARGDQLRAAAAVLPRVSQALLSPSAAQAQGSRLTEPDKDGSTEISSINGGSSSAASSLAITEELEQLMAQVATDAQPEAQHTQQSVMSGLGSSFAPSPQLRCSASAASDELNGLFTGLSPREACPAAAGSITSGPQIALESASSGDTGSSVSWSQVLPPGLVPG